MAHPREIEEDELSGHRPGERLQQLDVAADAVEEEERKARTRAGLAADAQQLGAHAHHFDRKRARRPGRGLRLRDHPQAGPAYGSTRRSLRRILPTADLGSASMKRTCLGTLYAARARPQCAITSASVSAAPGARTTKSLTASPVFSSGFPTQAHSAIPGQAAATASTSFG